MSKSSVKNESDLISMGYMSVKKYAKSLNIDISKCVSKTDIIEAILKYKESVEPNFKFGGRNKLEEEAKNAPPKKIKPVKKAPKKPKLEQMDIKELEKQAISLNIDLKNVKNTKEAIIKAIKKQKEKIEMDKKIKEYEEYLKKQETNPDMKKKPRTPRSLKTDPSKLLEEYKEEIKESELIGVIKDIKESNKTLTFGKFKNENGYKTQHEIKLRPDGTGTWGENNFRDVNHSDHHIFLHKGKWKIIGSEKLLMVGVLFRQPVPSDSDDDEPEKDGWLVNCGNWKHKNGMHSRIFTEKELSKFKISKS